MRTISDCHEIAMTRPDNEGNRVVSGQARDHLLFLPPLTGVVGLPVSPP